MGITALVFLTLRKGSAARFRTPRPVGTYVDGYYPTLATDTITSEPALRPADTSQRGDACGSSRSAIDLFRCSARFVVAGSDTTEHGFGLNQEQASMIVGQEALLRPDS